MIDVSKYFLSSTAYLATLKIDHLKKRLSRKATLAICGRGLYDEYTANWRDSCGKMLGQEERCNLNAVEEIGYETTILKGSESVWNGHPISNPSCDPRNLRDSTVLPGQVTGS